MKIKIPEGFEIPPDVEPGAEFTVTATFVDNEDGTITLKEVDGSKIEEEDEKEEKEEKRRSPETTYDRAMAAGVPMKGGRM